jgi:RNase P/RNase MRP subunit p30
MEFIDACAGAESPEKLKIAKELGIRLAPGDYSLLVSNDHRKIRAARAKTDLVAARPQSKQELNSLLTDAHYFLLVDGFAVGKRNVRMARRYETAIAVPVAPAFSLKVADLARVRRNLLRVQEENGTLLLCSGAGDASQVRGGRELASIGVLFGLKPDYATKAVKQWPSAIIERNRGKQK